MPFFQMDDRFDSEERVGRAGTAAFGLYSRCGVWVARNLKDGFVPDWVATMYGSAEWARKLVEVGLWVAVDGGFMMPDYLTTHRNKTSARVEEERAQKAVRQANWLAAKKQNSSSKGKRGSSRDTRQGISGSRDASQDGSLTPAPPLPSPKGEGVGAAPRSGGAAPPTQNHRATSDSDPRDWRQQPGSGQGELPPDEMADLRANLGAKRGMYSGKSALPKYAPPKPVSLPPYEDIASADSESETARDYARARKVIDGLADREEWLTAARMHLAEVGEDFPGAARTTITAAELYQGAQQPDPPPDSEEE